MDRRGGCCITRYQNGSVYDMSNVDRIMLKFRPIAPKPVVGSPTQSNEQTSSKNNSKSGRGKRKYNKANNNKKQKKRKYNKENNNKKQKKNNSGNKKKKANSDETELSRKTSSDSVVTLSLLPETPERKESFVTVKVENKSQSPVWLSFAPSDGGHVEKRTALMAPKPVTSIVTVECVADTWLDGNVLGRNDHERMVKLGEDTFPCFVSDGLDRVWWTNRAYGETVGSEEVIVQLVKMVSVTCDAFSCRARVRCREGKDAKIMTFPCDVWRMDRGGYAWRLDVEAALSLGFRV